MSTTLAPEPSRPSAQIYQLPGAAAVPVVNPARTRGRPPKGVTVIGRGKQIREGRELSAQRTRIQQEIAIELMCAAFGAGKGKRHD